MSDALKEAARNAGDVLAGLKEPIRDNAQFIKEAHILRDTYTKWREAFALKEEDLAPVKTALKTLEARHQKIVEPLRQLSKALKGRLESYTDEQIHKQTGMLEAAATVADADEAAKITQRALELMPPDNDLVSLRRAFYAAVVDLEALPTPFFDRKPRMKVIKREAKAGVEIPGVESGHKAAATVRQKRT